MMQFVFLAVLAATFMPGLSVGGVSLSHFKDAKSLDFHEICTWFCAEEDYEDYSFFRSLDHAVHPRIFCELCKKKTTSTTPATTTSGTTATPKTSTSDTTTTSTPTMTTTTPTTAPTTPTTQPTTTTTPTSTTPTTTQSTTTTTSTTPNSTTTSA